jgi:L-amino acid N-acyltransferase YncA
MTGPRRHLRDLTPDDAERVREILAEGYATGHAALRRTPAPWLDIDRGYRPDCRIAADVDGQLAGFAMIAPASSHCGYEGVAELSVYVAAAARGRGVGDALLAELIAASERAGVWTLVASIFPENVASVRLHERHGFRRLGVRERVGFMTHGPLAGTWRDVVVFERRSAIVGV